MADNKAENKVQQQTAKGPFVHQLVVYLVGGQTFTINEVTDSPAMPGNVIAFINAWRQKKDVWHSPNNDPKFGVRLRDISLYEYRVGTPAPKAGEQAAAPAAAAPAEKPAKKAAEKAAK